MKDLDVTFREQPGGWFVAQILTIDEITSCPTILTNSNTNKIVITPKYDGLDILPVRESIKINATPNVNGSGTSYNITGEFEIATQTKDLDTYFNACINNKVVLLGQKHDGQQILYGSPNCPLEFSYKAINGVKFQDGSSFKLYVKGKVPQKPVFL